MTAEIIELNETNKHYHNQSNEPFDVFGRLVVTFKENEWHYTEKLFHESKTKHYDDEEINLEDYISNDNRVIFFALEDDTLLGQITLRRHWNKYCYIDDIAVKSAARKKGVGTSLLNKAEEWARNRGLSGFMLETQDINLGACRFYIKNGFHLGGVDIMLYENYENKAEKALFWYKKFV